MAHRRQGSTSKTQTQTPGGRGTPESVPGSSLREQEGKEWAGPDGGVYEVLRYVRSAFDEEEVLDAMPLEAAGNPGAWHAWRTYRAKKVGSDGKGMGKLKMKAVMTPWHERLEENGSGGEVREEVGSEGEEDEGEEEEEAEAQSPARKAGEWNWEGVWEIRSRRGIEGSLSDSVLYGSGAGDDLVSVAV